MAAQHSQAANGVNPGLVVLLGGGASGVADVPSGDIAVDLIDVREQVRTLFDDTDGLFDSVKSAGIQQPLLVKPVDGGRYRLIAGERRLRAAKAAGQSTVPVRLFPADISRAEERRIQVAENLQRTPLSLFDVVRGVQQDVEEFGHQEAQRIWGRSAAWISKRCGVASLPRAYVDLIRARRIDDIELLGSLGQLHEVSPKEASAMARRLEQGDSTVTRETLRTAVALAKERLSMQARAATQSTASSEDAAPSTDAQARSGHVEADAEVEADGADDGAVVGEDAAPARPAKPAAKAAAKPAGKRAGTGDRAVDSARERLAAMRASISEISHSGAQALEELQREAKVAGLAEVDLQWLTYVALADWIVPALRTLPPKLGAALLRKLEVNARTQGPVVTWNKLHPPLDGHPDTPTAVRDMAPARPRNWTM